MTGEVNLIVNADDFGLSDGVNRGIVRAHREGILTSASLMVRQPAAAAAARLAQACPRLSVGLHLDLGEWVYRNGEWSLLYQVAPADDRKAVEREVTRQIHTFRQLLHRHPTHLDSHQHVHRHEPVRSVMVAAARHLGIPLRECSDTVRFCGDFYGQTREQEPFPEGISVDHLLRIIGELIPGWTEVSCHAGDDEQLKSAYSRERKLEVETLCDPRVRAALGMRGIQLRSSADLLGAINSVGHLGAPASLPANSFPQDNPT